MMGKYHLIVNLGVAAAGVAVGSYLGTLYSGIGSEWFYTIWDTTVQYLFQKPLGPDWMHMILLSGMYVVGTLLPDIDSRTSLLGRMIYLPVEHRTWTHTLWVLLFLLPCLFVTPFFAAILAGYALHLIVDSVSYQGVCWLYPLSSYRTFSNGGKVKQHHWLKLYRCGKVSEGVFLAIVSGTCGLLVLYFGVYLRIV